MYLNEIAKRRRMNTPSSISATPTTDDITLAEATKRAQVSNQVKASTDRVSLRGREMGDDARLSQEWLDTANKYSTVASGIEVANLGLTGMKAMEAKKALGRRDALRQKQFDQTAKNNELTIRMADQRMAKYDQMISMFSKTDTPW